MSELTGVNRDDQSPGGVRVTGRKRPSAFRLLNRRGTRTLLGVAASAYMLGRWRTPALIYHSSGDWVHRHRDGAVVDNRVRAAPLTELHRRASEVHFFGYLPKPGDVVVDVGAGVGIESLLAARLVSPRGRVFAIEAHPTTFHRFLRACQLERRLDVVTPIHRAIASQSGRVSITDDMHHTGNHLTTTAISGARVVEAIALDDLIRELGLEQINLIKMNIEGAELQAIESMKRTLDITQNVAIHCHDFLAERRSEPGLATTSIVKNTLHKAGFELMQRADDPRPHVRDIVYGTRT